MITKRGIVAMTICILPANCTPLLVMPNYPAWVISPPLSGGGGGPEAASYTRTAAAGTVAAGAKSVTIANLSSTIAALVDGTSLDAGQSVNWAATAGSTLDAIVYDPQGGELAIVTVI